MIVGGILLYFLVGRFVLTSSALYGVETYGGEEWWTNYNFLKFYSPSGKNYFIDYEKGELSLESLESVQDSAKELTSPYISFVSFDLKVFDIFFEQNDLKYTPRIVEKLVNFNDKSTFVRHILHSFVGPNKQIYKLIYKNSSNYAIEPVKPEKSVDYLQIKTLGPYAKWEHTYTFSQNGDTATDLTLSPVQIKTDRSIQVPEMKSEQLMMNGKTILAHFNTPSGKNYLVTDKLNIALDQDKLENMDRPYITFIEPNEKSYDIFFRKDGTEHYVAELVPKDDSTTEEQNFFGKLTTQLLSFVGPDRKNYRIDRDNVDEVPVLDSTPSTPSDFRVTFVQLHKHYKKFVNFVFSNGGSELHDRVDEFDFTPLARQPALSVDEVDRDSDIAGSYFLTFYSPSGRTYYLTPGDSKAKYAVAKGTDSITNSPYISFALKDGKTSNIYYKSNGVTELELVPSANRTALTSVITLESFVTPDKMSHKVKYNVENDTMIPYIDITAQPMDPFDVHQEECLKIVITTTSRQYIYLFTWNGDKLVEALSFPRKRVSSNVIKSLIG